MCVDMLINLFYKRIPHKIIDKSVYKYVDKFLRLSTISTMLLKKEVVMSEDYINEYNRRS